MYISKIQLKNIRCIDNLVLDLRSRASTNSSLLLLGNNGVGKSTILKCIVGLIRFCGHVPKGGYDVQNGINEGRETGATTV